MKDGKGDFVLKTTATIVKDNQDAYHKGKMPDEIISRWA